MPTIRVPLAHSPTNRDATTTKDSRLVNCYLELIREGEPAVVKRPGLSINTSVGAGLGLGIYQWLNDLYEVRNTSLYKNGVLVGTVNGTGGQYYFAGMRYVPK